MAMSKRTSERNNPLSRQGYNELRKRYRKQLIRSVYPTEVLLSALCAIESFDKKVQYIRSMETKEEIVDKLLSLPDDENFERTINHFMSALSENGHAHVAKVFTTGSNKELLTDENYQLLSDKLADLCTYLDPACTIIHSLISGGVFTQSDADRVEVQTTATTQVGEMIKILLCKPNDSYQRFINILERNDQEHVVYILTGNGNGSGNGSPPISKANLNRINKQRQTIVKHMDSMHTSFVSTLVSSGVFTDYDRERAEAVKVRHKRNEEILNILVRKSTRHLKSFIAALRETHQGHIADFLAGLELHGTVDPSCSTEQQPLVESKLRPALAKKLDDKESEISHALDAVGIHDSGVDFGCIRIWFKFLTKETLDMMRSSDELDRLFTKQCCALEEMSDISLQRIHIEIPDSEFRRCEQIIDERKTLMTPEHQHALQLATDRMADKISVDENLLKGLSLGEYREDAILNQSSSEEKAKVLLEVMMCRPDCEFEQLLSVLRKSHHTKVATFIMSK